MRDILGFVECGVVGLLWLPLATVTCGVVLSLKVYDKVKSTWVKVIYK